MVDERRRSRRELAFAWAAWADEAGFQPHEHDAAYEGWSSAIPVVVETGVRESGLYDVVVTVAIACGLAPVLVKRSDPPSPGEPRVVDAIRRLFADVPELRSAAIGEDDVVLRFAPRTHPYEIPGGLRGVIARIVAAWSAPDATPAPYR